MGILSNCFCDPFKLTYVSAIFTSVEAVAFGTLNIVFMCMYKCVIKPPNDVGLGFDRFWSYYFFDNTSCIEKDYDPPWWTRKYVFPFPEERSLTTPEDNYLYQTIYLGLHTAWFLTAMILIYGNARKKWGYYIPWLLVSLTIMVMDITISAFCITDLVTVTSDDYVGAMFWILALYFRLFLIFFMNMSKSASVINAFCKARHKRTKQARQREKLAKAHQEEIARAEAAAEARARAQMADEYQQREQHQYPPPGGNAEMRRKIPPPVPKKPAAPPELRPFSYLNPAFRPNDPTDVEGMRAHSALPEDLVGGATSTPGPLPGPYFPSDGYDRQHPAGFPRRHDSVRTGRTQAPHPALRRFSSTRIQPNHHRRPLEPTPDYDFTIKRGPSTPGQCEYPHDFLVIISNSGGGGDGHMSLSPLAITRSDTDLPLSSSPMATHDAPSSVDIPTPTIHIDTPSPHTDPLRNASSLPDILPPPPRHHPSPILYTKTMNRTHLQIYTPDSGVEDDSLILQEPQTDKLIFGGVFVPSYSRRLTSYISNSVLKGNRDEKDELPACYWNDQWRNMKEGRVKSSQTLNSEIRHRSFSHTLHRSEGNETRVARDEGMEHIIRENRSNSKNKPHIPKASPEETEHPSKTKATTLNNGITNKSLSPDTVDLTMTRRNEDLVRLEPSKTLNRHTIAGHRSTNGKKRWKRRKLSETYFNVSTKGESNFNASLFPPRPSSISSEDLLPNDPAFPIMHRATRLYAY